MNARVHTSQTGDRDRWHSYCPDGRQGVPHGGRERGELHRRYVPLPNVAPRSAEAERAAHKLAGPVVIVAVAGADEPRILPRVPANRTQPFGSRGKRHCWGF